MARNFTQEVFELKPLIKSIDVKTCTHGRNGVKQILALITQDNDIVLYYCYGELPPVIKRVPWISDSGKTIHAACFDPTATWLLIVSLDSSFYIIPALYIVDKRQKIDCKWSLTDITSFPKCCTVPNLTPTCCVWWQTLECNQNAFIGFDTGRILLISLTDGRVLGECRISERVSKLHLCLDSVKETVSLLINGESERQWRLVLEKHSNGYTWPLDVSNTNIEESVKSTFHTLKQISVDKFVSLRQRLGSRKEIQNDSTESTYSEVGTPPLNDSSDSLSSCTSAASLELIGCYSPSFKLNQWNNVLNTESDPVLLPQFIDTLFTPQTCRNRTFFSALYRPTGLLTIHGADFETRPVFVHRVMPRTHFVIMTDNLIYTLNQDINVLSVISCQLSESRLEGDAQFNDESLVAQFMVENEDIIDFFKSVDMSVDVTPNKNNAKNKFLSHKNKNDSTFLKTAIDTCIIVTSKNVYKLFIRNSPVQRFIDYVIDENDLEKAEKLSYIFNLNLQHLFEYCGDLMISNGSYHSGIILYKQAKVHILKRVLKLAITADCRTLLKFVHLCLNASRIDMNITTRIHIGNVAVMAYVELLLRSNNSEQMKANTKDFMTFLVHESHFDPILAVNMTCQAGHWNIVNLLAKSRGLQPETVIATAKILQNGFCAKLPHLDFLYALSEPSLIQSLLIMEHSSQMIFKYIKENVDAFPVEILKRLTVQLDPSQPYVIPFLRTIINSNKTGTTTDTNIESFEFDSPDSCVVITKDLVETFLYVILSLSAKTGNHLSFDLELLENVTCNAKLEEEAMIHKMPDLRVLSCGYEHAAVIRNNCVYTMGVAASGCLGIGPMLTNTSGPRLVNTLHDLKVMPLSVSCGKKHTLCATDSGVFTWGSNSHGQLGLGPQLQETPYPQLVTALSKLKIVDVSAGQYHSLALTHSGRVYSWGWGIHGQLGHGCSDNEYYPRLLVFDSLVRQIAAGHAHSLILTCDGKIYGFGSNVFAQLENNCCNDSKKSTRPTWIVILPDIYVPIERIATSYFHNMAVTADQKVYMWGASPEEVRCFQQRSSQKQNNRSMGNISTENWKSSIQVYHAQSRRPIKQISVGYHHYALLDQGRIMWGKNKEEEVSQPNIRDPYEGLVGHRFVHVSCGWDYTMAIDQNGQVLAWGTPAMMETILGVTGVDSLRKKQEDRTIIFKGTKRTFKHPITNNMPVEISVLPSTAFSFTHTSHKTLLYNQFVPYNVILVDNKDSVKYWFRDVQSKSRQDFEYIYDVPDLKVGQKTVHFALQSFSELYDVENVIRKSQEYGNYQAAGKVSILSGHFVDSLGFIIEAFKRHISSNGIDLPSLFTCKDSYDVKEKDKGIELIMKATKSELNKENSSNCASPARVLSSSSSMDSLKQFGEEGGQEGVCDINITNFIHSMKSDEVKVPKLNENYKDLLLEKSLKQQELQVKSKQAKEVLDLAASIVEFYLKKVYASENHILMQNILVKCIEFWLMHNLPVFALENIFLKNLDKYFYPLSILLFCKNFDEDVILKKDENVIKVSSTSFLKEFSTKFCLHLCSLVLENANKA